MKKIILLITITLNINTIKAQEIYSKAYGNKTNPAVIYLHGGPGYNSSVFEATTAATLADSGFYVIVYDRRGEGRSLDKNAKYNFDQSISDLNNIFKLYSLQKAILIGHSFGGMLSIKYTEQFPEKVEAIALVGAPINLQASFKHIIFSCNKIYTAKNDKTNLYYIKMLQTMDTTSIEYSTYCFLHAMQNGFYTPKQMSKEAKTIYTKFSTDSLLIKNAQQMTTEAPKGFWQSDKYTTLDFTKNLKTLKSNGTKIAAFYGKEDGLYSLQQINELEKIVGNNNMLYLDNCSHNFYIDQQNLFIKGLNLLKPTD
jgi:proline iminopeptidase